MHLGRDVNGLIRSTVYDTMKPEPKLIGNQFLGSRTKIVNGKMEPEPVPYMQWVQVRKRMIYLLGGTLGSKGWKQGGPKPIPIYLFGNK